MVARAAAIVGLIMLMLAAIYALPMVLFGFANWAEPNVYVTLVVLALGLTVNWFLYRRSGSLPLHSAVGLTLISVAVSAIIAITFGYMVVGP